MAEERIDRRVGRTRRRLKRALTELIRERDYESITIRELTERADVGRSTFYSHFRDKEDLLFDGFDDWLLSLAGGEETGPEARTEGHGRRTGGDPSSARFGFSLPLLRHIRSQRRFFQATILGGRGARVRRRTTELFVRMMRAELERTSGARIAAVGRGVGDEEGELAPHALPGFEPGLVMEARARCLTGAFLELASWWLAERRRLSPEDVDALFRTAMGPGTGLAYPPRHRADRPGPPSPFTRSRTAMAREGEKERRQREGGRGREHEPREEKRREGGKDGDAGHEPGRKDREKKEDGERRTGQEPGKKGGERKGGGGKGGGGKGGGSRS